MSNQIPETLINYEMYSAGARLVGNVDVTLPNIQFVTTTVQGAGLIGPMDVPVLGHVQDMTATVNFRTAHRSVRSLLTPQYHHVELWGALQQVDSGTGKFIRKQHKVIMRMMIKNYNIGTFNPGEPQGRSLEFQVSYFKEMLDMERITEIDKLNYICFAGGVDHLAAVRALVGR